LYVPDKHSAKISELERNQRRIQEGIAIRMVLRKDPGYESFGVEGRSEE
jgi:hypothetical protein